MQFVVEIRASLPAEWTAEELTEMLRRETVAAIAFIDQSILLRIDRVVGRGGNISIWQTDSLEQLDLVLASLPLAPYLDFMITPIVKHRVQIAYEAELKNRGAN